MSLLVNVLITVLVIVVLLYLVRMLPINRRAKEVVRLIVIILGILSIIRYLGVF
jgi:hypothetical protein